MVNQESISFNYLISFFVVVVFNLGVFVKSHLEQLAFYKSIKLGRDFYQFMKCMNEENNHTSLRSQRSVGNRFNDDGLSIHFC